MANGDKAFPKERVEVFGGSAVAVLDNFRKLELVRGGRHKVVRSWLGQDKGHLGEWEAFVGAIHERNYAPIAAEEILSTTLATFSIMNAFHGSTSVKVFSKELLGDTS